MNRLLALFAFVVLAGFLYILAAGVPRIDLIAVILLTVVLVAWDMITSSKNKSDRNDG
jgi:thiol:disulfide interchange protein